MGRKENEARRKDFDGLKRRWVTWPAGLLFFLFHFFLIYASPLFSYVFSETQRERGKGLEDFKTDSIYCLKNISKVCN
jgi:hypothetical protein